MTPLITVLSLQTLLILVLLIYALIHDWKEFIMELEVVIFCAVAFPVSFCFLVISYFMCKKIFAESL